MRLATFIGAAAILMGLCVMSGWGLAVPGLITLGLGVPVHPLVAFAFALAGAALLLSRGGRRRALGGRVLAAIVAVTGALCIAGVDLGLASAAPAPAPTVATGLVLLGGTLALLEARPVLAQTLAAGTFGLGLLGLVDALYAFPGLPREPGPRLAMSLPAAATLVLVPAAALIARPGLALSELATAAEPISVLARRTLLIALAVLVLVGWLRLEGERARLYDARFGTAMFASAAVLLFGATVIWAVKLARGADEARRNLIEETRRASLFLDAVIENLPDMVFVKDADQLAFRRMNRAGEELLGLWRGDLIGKTDRDFFPIEEAVFFEAKDRETLASGRLVDIPEEPIDTRRGRRWLHTKKVPITDGEGRPAFLLGISQDITEHKLAQDELRRAKEAAEAATRELEAFSYSVSHDLRAPLRSIDGFSMALLEDHGDALDATGKHYLTRVRAGAQRMAALIDDMLELARVGRAELRRERVDLADLAREIVGELREVSPARDVTLVVPDELVVDGDARLLRIALVNLLGNAWKFTSKQPTATIELGRSDGDPAELWVRDDGVGFDPEYANKLFGAFQRLHAASEFEGTGIGLATVRRIVERHGGAIRATSKPGRGATFTFTLSGSQENA